ETLDMFGRRHVEEILVEIGADELPATRGKTGLVELLEEWREARRNGRVEHHLRTARLDPTDCLAVVRVLQREILLTDDGAAVGCDQLAYSSVHHARPNVVS